MPNLRNPNFCMVFVQGRMTRDPELKYTSGRTAVCTFAIANSEYYKDKTGESKERVSFFDVRVWAKSAEYVSEHFRKGADVQVSGRLVQETWDDKQTGAKRSKCLINAQSVQALSWPDDGDARGQTARAETQDADPIQEDDIPF